MSDSTSKNQQALHPSSSQNTSTMQDRRQGLDQPLGGILERITHVYLSLDHEWRVTYVNYQVEPVLQKTREALLGKSLWEAFPEAVGSTFYRRYHEALHIRPSAHSEEFYPSLQKWFEVDIFLSTDGIEVHIQDITERKRLEERLQESEKRFRALIEHSADVITLVDLNGTVLYASPSIQPVLGYQTAT